MSGQSFVRPRMSDDLAIPRTRAGSAVNHDTACVLTNARDRSRAFGARCLWWESGDSVAVSARGSRHPPELAPVQLRRPSTDQGPCGYRGCPLAHLTGHTVGHAGMVSVALLMLRRRPVISRPRIVVSVADLASNIRPTGTERWLIHRFRYIVSGERSGAFANDFRHSTGPFGHLNEQVKRGNVS